MKNIKNIIIGIVTGFANGLFGSGGGTILVPATEKILNLEPHKAHATAISIILPLSIISLIIYWLGDNILWQTALFASLGGVCGSFLGAKLLGKLSGVWLHRIFGGFMIIAGIRMVFV